MKIILTNRAEVLIMADDGSSRKMLPAAVGVFHLCRGE